MQHPGSWCGAVMVVGLLWGVGCATKSSLVLKEPTVVDAACGECRFGMTGKDCELAVRIAGRGYFVEGVALDSLGDAHAADGMCNAVRQARVTGEVRDGRFLATSFALLPSAALRGASSGSGSAMER